MIRRPMTVVQSPALTSRTDIGVATNDTLALCGHPSAPVLDLSRMSDTLCVCLQISLSPSGYGKT